MEYKQFSRKEILEEELLRMRIREAIEIARQKKSSRDTEVSMLRSVIRELIAEAKTEAAPHESTGINVLEDLLKKIVPQLEPDYKKLTTDKKQRDSFRAHVLNAIENAIAPKEATAMPVPGGEEGEEEGEAPVAEPIEEFRERFASALKEIEINVGAAAETEEGDEDKFVDIDQQQQQPEPKDDFAQLAGEDATGRNMAMQSFQKIERSVQDSYALLDNEEDQKLFKDYLLTNIKLYFDKFEDELGAGGTEEPTTPEYEEEKGKAKDTEAAGGEETPEGGGEEAEGGEEAGAEGGEEGGEEFDFEL